MTIHAALHHVTHYQYDRPVQLGPQVVRLRPAPHCRSRVLSYSLSVEPAEHFVNWQQDPFANYQARLVFPAKTTVFKVTVDLVVEMAVYNPFDFFLETAAETFPFAYSPELGAELTPYLAAQPLAGCPLLASYLKEVQRELAARTAEKPLRTIDFLVYLNQRVAKDIRYLIRLEPGVQTPERTLELASGSCRDSGWLLVQLLRHMGLAARFVSGYLIQLKPDVKSLDGPSGTDHDFTDLHAWAEVYLPGAGWVGMDATSGLMAGEGHIPLACTPAPGSAAPIEGLVDEAEVEFAHEMRVSRVYESPRVTLPYTDHQWNAVLALGDQVEADLQAGDVRLTHGGEPTFVAASDRDAPEWNTDALGPTKRNYATELVHKLRQQYAPGGFLHLGQGKWYPGEQLPRWALTVAWRADGVPIWRNPALLADERAGHRFTSADAERFGQTLCANLGITPRFLLAGYEDVWYYLWRERRLPTNVDPLKSRLDDEMERVRLRRVFGQQLSHVIGYALPLQPDDGAVNGSVTRWLTGPWFLRDERLYLFPGDSPMGFRLPLDSLPWAPVGERNALIEQDPFAPRGPLPPAPPRWQSPAAVAGLGGASTGSDGAAASGLAGPSDAGAGLAGASASAGAAGVGVDGAGLNSAALLTGTAPSVRGSMPTTTQPGHDASAHWIVRTALCIEVRDPQRANGPKAEVKHGLDPAERAGVIYVFMPPLPRLEDYLALVNAIEDTAEQLQMPVVLEGYPPPRDPRLKTLAVTPDPGVIEVNVHPAHNWRELVEHTEFLYRAAWECRLSAEKFMLDGRHTGTGGGNHVVLGGATPADSPFLRRPDVLASLILYWHNHPALSYIFSGQFIGPTSQAPRVDEARNDQLYELELALREVHRVAGLDESRGQAPSPPYLSPWLLDRTLRNILIDVTGNTHRSEFCIDKMYSPDSATGRLGLLELRAFEMPPHERMSVVQMLLLRALVARFWKQPYLARPTRWGTAVHDRFMLHAFVQQDMADVVADLGSHGYAFDAAWFAPHLEFRFPLIGTLDVSGLQITLRQALEPWHVMGEESASGATARYVDSSLERVEVHASGYNASRWRITVNGVPLPMQPTGVAQDWAAGVRYKAWNPPSSLHPLIGVHAPLTVDVVDTWNGRSVGGCQVHVAHPGGLSHSTFPVNAYEAESRRLTRFVRMGHTSGGMPQVPPLVQPTVAIPASPEFPCTLDLRWAK